MGARPVYLEYMYSTDLSSQLYYQKLVDDKDIMNSNYKDLKDKNQKMQQLRPAGPTPSTPACALSNHTSSLDPGVIAAREPHAHMYPTSNPPRTLQASELIARNLGAIGKLKLHYTPN